MLMMEFFLIIHAIKPLMDIHRLIQNFIVINLLNIE